MQNSIRSVKSIHSVKSIGKAETTGKTKSIGIVEVTGSANAVYAADIMLKAAEVSLYSWETVFGIGRVTVFVRGDVASVTAALEAVKESEACEVFASYMIANPHPETQRFLLRSAKKLER